MRPQKRAVVVGKSETGGGQLGQASLYELETDDGLRLRCDYIEIASDGFRTLGVGERVWCNLSSDDPSWAVYVVPIRDVSPRALLGLREEPPAEPDLVIRLWL